MVHILGQETLEDKIKAFQERRKKIVEMQAQNEIEEKALHAWVETTEVFKKFKAKVDAYEKELALYKADQEATFGLVDGERSDVLKIVAAIKKVGALS